MNKIKLGIIEDNASLSQKLAAYFKALPDFDVILTAGNGLDAVAEVEKKKPDAILLDIVLPDLDGFGVMDALSATYLPKIIVISALTQDAFIQKAARLGAAYYIMKPFDLDNVRDRLYDVIAGSDAPQTPAAVYPDKYERKSTDERITNIFITVGIPAHIKGYYFLREAVKMAIDSPDIINSITKRLYPNIAAHFNTSASKVERAIRHAIEVAWNRGKIENINNVFGIKVYNANEKPTNGEFIALVADKMLMEGA
ncbi:MAG: sporulation transcription factor Spo0A [Firmicutes bacterium]|nr:sporulation transcription factor Spo0A [Bacillota bacterium]